MGEDEQYEISEEILNEINICDNNIVEKVKKMNEILNEIRNEIVKMQNLARKGKRTEFKKSDFAIPPKDIDCEEIQEYFAGEGIIPG